MSKFHEISLKGKHWLHRIADVDTYTHEGSADKARMIYSEDDEKVYVGSGAGWLKFTTAYDVLGQGSKCLIGTFPLPVGWNIDTSADDIWPTLTPNEGGIGDHHDDDHTWTILGIQGSGAHNHGGRTKGAQGDTILIGESDIYTYVGDDRHNHNIQNAVEHFHSFADTWRPAYIKYCVAEYQ